MGIFAYQTKKGKRYRAELYLNGERVSRCAPFETKKEAKAWLVTEEKRLLSPKPIKTGTDFLTLANAYLDDMEARRQRVTFVGKKSVIRRFLEHMGGASFNLEDLTIQDIDRFLMDRRVNTATQKQSKRDTSVEGIDLTKGSKAANRDLVELKAILNWAIRKDLYHRNPFRLAEKFPEEKFVRSVPTAEEIAQIRLVAQSHERDFIDALYFTGGRLSEICNLTWEDLNFEKRVITLWTRKRRGGSLEPRHLAMVDRLYATLSVRWKDADRHPTHVFYYPPTKATLKKNHPYVRDMVPNLCKKAKITRYTAHCIRHHVATRLKDSRKATAFQIKEFLGHKNMSTTERYLHELDVDHQVASILEDEPSFKSDFKSDRVRK